MIFKYCDYDLFVNFTLNVRLQLNKHLKWVAMKGETRAVEYIMCSDLCYPHLADRGLHLPSE